jgi:hypothetical protein
VVWLLRRVVTSKRPCSHIVIVTNGHPTCLLRVACFDVTCKQASEAWYSAMSVHMLRDTGKIMGCLHCSSRLPNGAAVQPRREPSNPPPPVPVCPSLCLAPSFSHHKPPSRLSLWYDEREPKIHEQLTRQHGNLFILAGIRRFYLRIDEPQAPFTAESLYRRQAKNSVHSTAGVVPQHSRLASMDGPNTVRLQRRRNELPPDQLFVERKRKNEQSVDEARNYYIRQKRDNDTSHVDSELQYAENTGNGSSAQSAASALEARRVFHLKHTPTLAASVQSTKTRKRKQNDEPATVVEKRREKAVGDESVVPLNQIGEDDTQQTAPSAPPKRPGRGSAIRPRANKAEPVKPENENIVARQQRELAALAQEMHQFALDELAKTPKPQIKTKPKLPPSRSRALHEQQVPASPSRAAPTKDADEDTAMDSDSEYVYDTYVLAPAPTSVNGNEPIDVHKTLAVPSNVGYLIITEDDEQLWETYIHDLEGSDSEPTDEDDENGKPLSLLKSKHQNLNSGKKGIVTQD